MEKPRPTVHHDDSVCMCEVCGENADSTFSEVSLDPAAKAGGVGLRNLLLGACLCETVVFQFSMALMRLCPPLQSGIRAKGLLESQELEGGEHETLMMLLC